MIESLQTLGWVLAFTLAAGLGGVLIVLASALLLPRILNRFTPSIDEEAEIARGNLAVATFFGKLVSSSLIAVAIVVAAALIGGIILVAR